MYYVRLSVLAALCVVNLMFVPSVNAQDTGRPIPISAPRPLYPPYALSKGIGSTVLVDIEVNSEGKVVKAKIVMGHEVFREPARKAAMGFRFKPFESATDKFTVRLTYIFHDKSYVAPEKEPDFKSPYQLEITCPYC
ncbi:MAG: TonB family protein [Acidobacteria bacterium]|nr:TonB family protein [Acidobacteriota bacterium]